MVGKDNLTAIIVLTVFGCLAILLVLAYIFRPRKPNDIGVPGAFASSEQTGNITEIVKAGSLHRYLLALHEQHGPLATFYVGSQLVLSAASPKMLSQLEEDCCQQPIELFHLFDPLRLAHDVPNASDHAVNRKVPLRCERFVELYRTVSSLATKLSDRYQAHAAATTKQPVNASRDLHSLALDIVMQAAFGEVSVTEAERETVLSTFQTCLEDTALTAGLQQRRSSLDMDPCTKSRCEMLGIFSRQVWDWQDKPNAGTASYAGGWPFRTKGTDDKMGDFVSALMHNFFSLACVLTWTVYRLSRNHAAQNEVGLEAEQVLGSMDGSCLGQAQTHLRHASQAVEDTWHGTPLVPWDGRCYEQDREIGGKRIPAQTPIILAIAVSRQRPDEAADREGNNTLSHSTPLSTAKGDLEQHATTSVMSSDASGPKCPSWEFSNLACMIVLSTLCQHVQFTSWEISEMEKVHGLFTHPSRDILVTITKR